MKRVSLTGHTVDLENGLRSLRIYSNIGSLHDIAWHEVVDLYCTIRAVVAWIRF
jgi:hypothetical protein